MYIPKYFSPEEIFSKNIIKIESTDNIWRLMDERILWTVDKIREHFCGNKKINSFDVLTVNNWPWGGRNQLRGFRHAIYDKELIGKMTLTGQHFFGRALDFVLSKLSAEEIRQDIIANPLADRYKYITALEEDVTWVHIDIRNWNKNENGIFLFKG